ncbi:MAG: hypothetical protein HYU87_06155 [Chloroflexi bacterium]|nr:hypothetical protein [Chloroflexota bacterium]
MPIDLDHFLRRLADSFNSESRFYWPLVIAVFLGIVANTVWYYWRVRGARQSPAEGTIKPWAYWINVIFLIWALVLLMAKVPFYWYVASLALNVLALVYIYGFWLPPRDAAWERELRRLKYIPKPEQRKRRRR